MLGFDRDQDSGMRQPIYVFVFGRNIILVAMKTFPHLISLINRLY